MMVKTGTNIFFLGKGGVGKSTLAALRALYYSQQGFEVILVSMDPAHNQADIFEMDPRSKIMKVTERLSINEVDIDKFIKTYLNKVEEQISSTYRYLTAFNLEKYLEIIKYSPGIEEYALLIAFNTIIKKSDADYIIFDMPPTALAMKFFNLPSLSLLWLEKLIQLRQEIIEKREIISKIKLGKKEVERDKVLIRLQQQTEFYQNIESIFKDVNRTVINIIINPDKLSLLESQDIIQHLKRLQLTPRQIILNKYSGSDIINNLNDNMRGISWIRMPQATYPLVGINVLKNYLKEYPDVFDSI